MSHTPERESGNRVVTFGCRLNAYESEVMRGLLPEAGAENTLVFNTCAVTAEAERQARQAIRKARRENPDARIIVTGCAAQVNADSFAAMAEVDEVIGNAEKMRAASYHRGANARVRVDDIMSVRETAGHLLGGFDGRARAFVQVQNGCDHRCTFCIIPYGRGPSRSVPIGEIAQEVRSLVQNGYTEIVLTGVDLTSYGPDLPGQPTLGQMIRRVLAAVPELPRLRLSSLDPAEIDNDLWRLIAEEPRLMPHLHLSLQAGDDMVLKRMKRRHSRADALAFCERARSVRPDVVFGADIIAGFPTETDEMFENTLSFIAEAGLTFLHVFPYSEREGTPAARMPPVPVGVRKERAARLREVGNRQVAALVEAQRGQETMLVMEKPREGRSPHYLMVTVDDPQPVGALVPVRMSGVSEEGVLMARTLDAQAAA
ncbi:MAG: tRNA (N(6)-L-threonylcarbamoyladenosine(37)-C(2))-methylthiotransferase MtaB [Pseudomonadota bacterium]